MRRPSDLSKTERQEIADLYRSGIPTAEIGEAYDLTHGSVGTVALEEGCTPRHMRKSRLARMHGESPAPSVPTDIAELGLRADAGVPVVNSRIVAERFEKRHDNVLRDIDALISTSSNLRGCGWFRETRVDVPGGNGAILSVRSFDLTRDGFTLLAMGFTGKRALAFKLAYIDAFNRMEAALADATHTPERVNLAYTQAAAVAEQAARTVFSAVMAGADEDWRGARWLFCLSHTGQPQVQPVAHDALVLRMAELPRQVMEPGTSPTNRELVELAAACNQRLAQRMAHDARGLLN